MKRFALVSAALAALFFVSAVPTEARELIYGSWLSPKHGLNRLTLPPFFEAIAKDTGGEVTWKLVPGGQLANGRGTPKAVRDGLMDAGFGIAVYVANVLPATNMIFSTYVFGEDVAAATAATMETVLLHCPECLEEHKKFNAIPLAGYDASPYLLMCRAIVSKLSDLKGLKVRSSGAGVHLMTLAGATPVAMSPAQATTALQRGTLDCVLGAGSWIRSYGYADVIKSVLSYPMGISGPAMAFHMSRKTFLSLTPAQRASHVQHAPGIIARSVILANLAETEEVLNEAVGKGVKLTAGGEDFSDLIERFKGSQRTRNIEQATKFGVKNAEAIMAAWERALVKWSKLTPAIGRDLGKFETALRTEIYDKVNWNKL